MNVIRLFLGLSVVSVFGCELSGGALSSHSSRAGLLSEGANAVSACQGREALLARYDAALRGVRGGCGSDSDCVLVSASLRCQEVCPLAVPSVRADVVRATLSHFEATECPGAPQNCAVRPSCLPIESLRCERGQCVEVYGIPK